MPKIPSIDQCDHILTARGEILEIEERKILGKQYKTWKHAPKTFRSFFLNCMVKYADRTFISSPSPNGSGRESVTFKQVHERAEKLAGWMKEQGLGIGSRIAIGGSNSSGWVVAFMATHLIGGIAVCLNAMLPQDLMLHCLKTSKPHLVLVDQERLEALKPILSKLKELGIGQVVNFSDDLKGSEASLGDVKSGKGLEALDPESDGVIFFSSGTSGKPKAVLSTQRMALTNLWSGMVAPARAALRAGLTPPELPTASDAQRTVLLSIPLFHVTGCLSWLMRAVFAGSKIVMMRRWDVQEAVSLIEKEKVTVIGGVPAVVAAILQSPDMLKDRSFDTVFYGGAPPSKELAAEVKERWPSAGLVQGYGMTETNAYVCSIAGGDYVKRPDSTGPVVPVTDVRIVDPSTRKDLPEGKVGLLLVRGPQVMKEYYGNDEATASTLDADGWLDTGDVAEVDEEGFVYIRDRQKDIIIRGGENITSSEVENALYADKRVAEVVAIGIPDSILGELVGAIVALRSGHEGTEDDLLANVKPRLPRFAVPSLIILHDGPLPKNVNGKVVKKDLKPMLVAEWAKRQPQVKAKL